MTHGNYSDMSASEKKKEDWMNSKWRPMMGWSYMLTCICDFVVFPVLWSLIQAIKGGNVTSQWNPITLQGAGLYHLAMGAVLGVAAWSRGQEKMAGANNGGISSMASGMGGGMPMSSMSSPAPVQQTIARPASVPSATSFSAPARPSAVMTSSSGKPMPVQEEGELL